MVRGLLGVAAGADAEPLLEVARSMGPLLTARVHPTARFLVEHHRRAGDFCVVVSASPHELVEAVVATLGAHRAVGTRVEVRDGRLTGRLDGPFCYGADKLEALEREGHALFRHLGTSGAPGGRVMSQVRDGRPPIAHLGQQVPNAGSACPKFVRGAVVPAV